MHYEIVPAVTAMNKQLTPAQRNSSLFSEAPRIGAWTLRRGQKLLLSDEQFKAVELQVKRLLQAGAIEVRTVSGETITIASTVTVPAQLEQVSVSIEIPASEEKAEVSAPVEAAAVNDQITDAVTQVAAPEEVVEIKKSKKGKKE